MNIYSSVKQKSLIKRIKLFISLFILSTQINFSQGIGDIIVIPVQVNPDQTVKSFEKLNDSPSTIDSTKRIENINYSITSKAFKTEYIPTAISPAKMINEPLSKLYSMLIKAGYGTYNMPYAEIFYNNQRSKEHAYGIRLKHFSSSWQLENRGYSGFSDNEIFLNGKKFLKQHTLSADLNYQRNVVRFYGFTPLDGNSNSDEEKQTFNMIESKINLISHLPDSNALNHDLNFNFYYLGDNYKMNEYNFGLNGLLKSKIKGEKLNVFGSFDYYKNQMEFDTVANYIIKIMPHFEARGKNWKSQLGIMAAMDHFTDSSTKFYFYPKINFEYDIYNQIIIPYAGLGGDLKKNSFRSLTNENPFITSNPNFRNTNNNLEFYGGLKGSLSSKTNYDISAVYQTVSNLPLYVTDISFQRTNRFKIIYDEGTIFKISAQLKYTHKEKLNISAIANYYTYDLKNNKYAWHRPSTDVKLTANYNIKSKIIAKLDIYYISDQWALSANNYSGVIITGPVNLNGVADINVGAEYRYSKFLSAFINFNNIGNFRYYRWDNYPTQQFNLMVGFTFIPF